MSCFYQKIMQVQSRVRHISLIIAILAGLLGVPFYASAVCSYSGMSGPFSTNINFGQKSVPRDAPVGTVISTPTIGPTTTGGVYCSTPTNVNFILSLFTTIFSSTTYNTNIPGVGIQVYGSGGYPLSPAYTLLSNATTSMAGYYSSPSNFILVKTGAIPVGTNILNSGLLLTHTVAGFGDAYRFYVASGATVTAVACSITTPTIQVPLSDVLASSLTAIGTVANPKVFNLGLNCDAGARINVSMTGIQNTDISTAGVLQLSGAGSAGVATGVGVQILYNNSPLAINSNIVLKTSTGGQESFLFTAQYYQTKSVVTTGSANAIATLNLTYQ